MLQGCCSAASPCNHQKEHPESLCETCAKAQAFQPQDQGASPGAAERDGNPVTGPAAAPYWFDTVALEHARKIEDIFAQGHEGGRVHRLAKVQREILAAMKRAHR